MLLLFLTIIAVDQFSAWLRRKLVGDQAFAFGTRSTDHDTLSSTRDRRHRRPPPAVFARLDAQAHLIAWSGRGRHRRLSDLRLVVLLDRHGAGQRQWDIAGTYLADWVTYEVRPDIEYRTDGIEHRLSALLAARRKRQSRLAGQATTMVRAASSFQHKQRIRRRHQQFERQLSRHRGAASRRRRKRRSGQPAADRRRPARGTVRATATIGIATGST